VLAVNLHAPIQFCRELLPSLLARPEAHILNLSSICGLVAGGRLCAYHTSKFGLMGFSEALRAEYARSGLGVSALCPGLVRTRFFETAASGRPGKPVPTPPAWICSSPQRVARKAVYAIRRNRRLVLVSPLAYALYYTKRFAPGLLDALHHVGHKRRYHRHADEALSVAAQRKGDFRDAA
jgi:short-subunit dehydrogenase